MAVSAFPGYRLDVSGTICEGRDPDAAGGRTIRQDHGKTDRSVYRDARAGQLRSVLPRIRWSHLSYRGSDSGYCFLVVEHLGCSEQDERIGASITICFSNLSSLAVSDPRS